jgi:ABC-type Fe3+/spermidine/putrescine transport system ATPase subunit
VALREETRGELRELVARLGLTAVYVTHDQDEAFALCDRISVMSEGRILQTGAPRELYEHPSQTQVARFLGRNNLIRAMRLSAMHDADGHFKTLDGGHTLQLPVGPDDLAPINKPVVLAIRPEHLRLAREEMIGDNTLRATIQAINFAGATTTVKLDADGLLLEALVFRPDQLTEGDACFVSLPAEHLRVLGNEG